ncbi:MAG TPA: hypothetical protein VGN13_09225 [Solirubrobacteraceae bacterium]|jgi:hypothetical protein
MRKLVMMTGVLVGLMAQAAHAEPTQWADHRASIPAGEVRSLGIAGALTFRVQAPAGKVLAKTECQVTGLAAFWNETEHGHGEIRTMSFAGCTDATLPNGTTTCAGSHVELHPAQLPWSTILEASPTFYLDEWHGVGVDIRCAGGADYGRFAGLLTPKIGDVDDVDNWRDDDDDHLIFQPGRGGLEAPASGDSASVTGILEIEGQRIQAWRFPGPSAAPLASFTAGLAASPFGERES